jgi:hypothetical protein
MTGKLESCSQCTSEQWREDCPSRSCPPIPLSYLCKRPLALLAQEPGRGSRAVGAPARAVVCGVVLGESANRLNGIPSVLPGSIGNVAKSKGAEGTLGPDEQTVFGWTQGLIKQRTTQKACLCGPHSTPPASPQSIPPPTHKNN